MIDNLANTIKPVVSKLIRGPLRTLREKYRRRPDQFLNNVAGVLHVGANTGQERNHYHSYGLPVIWVEPIPELVAELRSNLVTFPKQIAIEALITDANGKTYDFHITNNQGASSSILELDKHKELWQDVHQVSTINLSSITLPTMLQDNGLEVDDYALIMDTQGSELLVLTGAVSILSKFKYIKTEVADFEAYRDCAQLDEMNTFMQQHGFHEQKRNQFAGNDCVGHYYDVLYQRSKE